MLFCFFFLFTRCYQLFENFSYSEGEVIDFEEDSNITTLFFFDNPFSGFFTNNTNSTEITGRTFSSDSYGSLKLNNNVTGFVWRINSSICPGKLYEVRTEQLLNMQILFPKRQEENDNSCLFFNNKAPKGKISIGLFGDDSSFTVYSNENQTLEIKAHQTDGQANKIQLTEPFFLKLGLLPRDSQLFLDVEMDDQISGSPCYSSPISRFYGIENITSGFIFDQTTIMCTNKEMKTIGSYLIYVVLAIFFIILAVIIYLLLRDSNRSSEVDDQRTYDQTTDAIAHQPLLIP